MYVLFRCFFMFFKLFKLISKILIFKNLGGNNTVFKKQPSVLYTLNILYDQKEYTVGTSSIDKKLKQSLISQNSTKISLNLPGNPFLPTGELLPTYRGTTSYLPGNTDALSAPTQWWKYSFWSMILKGTPAFFRDAAAY